MTPDLTETLDTLEGFIIITNREDGVIFANLSVRRFAEGHQLAVADTLPGPSLSSAPICPTPDKIAWATPMALENGHRLHVGRTQDNKGAVSPPSTPPLSTPSTHAPSPNIVSPGIASPGIEAKMRFISTISHEMRTPLNGILGMTQLLRDGGIDAHQETCVDTIDNAGNALLALVNDILDYSKIESQRFELDKRIFSPRLLIQGTAELLFPKAAEKGLELGYYISPGMPESLLGDEGRLRQILLNLVSNALKFTKTGGVIIDARAHAHPDDAATALKIAVIDTGIGIAPDDQKTVFEEFYQAHHNGPEEAQGTGLGLAIARRLARLMGGDISLQSTPGDGSRFVATAEVTADTTNRNARAISPLGDAAPVVVLTRSAVLRTLLDGQLSNLQVRRRFFADNAASALEILAQTPGCILLCDFPNAQEHGKELAAAARHALLLLSPLARNHLYELRDRGFDGYLFKPIREESLARRLSVCLERHGAPSRTKPMPRPPGEPDKEPDTAPGAAGGDENISMETRTACHRSEHRASGTAGEATTACRVLLAEDNQINTILAKAIIDRAGFTVDAVENGHEALMAVQRREYDVVLMDMHMPVMNGIEAAKAIRSLEIPAADIPIIALTANAMRSDQQSCLDAGMDEFLTKPFEPQGLIDLIQRWRRKRYGPKRNSVPA